MILKPKMQTGKLKAQLEKQQIDWNQNEAVVKEILGDIIIALGLKSGAGGSVPIRGFHTR